MDTTCVTECLGEDAKEKVRFLRSAEVHNPLPLEGVESLSSKPLQIEVSTAQEKSFCVPHTNIKQERIGKL